MQNKLLLIIHGMLVGRWCDKCSYEQSNTINNKKCFDKPQFLNSCDSKDVLKVDASTVEWLTRMQKFCISNPGPNKSYSVPALHY